MGVGVAMAAIARVRLYWEREPQLHYTLAFRGARQTLTLCPQIHVPMPQPARAVGSKPVLWVPHAPLLLCTGSVAKRKTLETHALQSFGSLQATSWIFKGQLASIRASSVVHLSP